MQSTTTASGEPAAGVSGEFHTAGGLLLAAKAARRRGFASDRVWFVGQPAHDRLGDDIGFAMPASLVREAAVVGAAIAILAGALFVITFPPKPLTDWLPRLLPGVLTSAVVGAAVGSLAAWLGRSARLGAYLQNAVAGGLYLKLEIPAEVAETERARLTELAELALREAKAESIRRLDGSVDINSPQSAAYVA